MKFPLIYCSLIFYLLNRYLLTTCVVDVVEGIFIILKGIRVRERRITNNITIIVHRPSASNNINIDALSLL